MGPLFASYNLIRFYQVIWLVRIQLSDSLGIFNYGRTKLFNVYQALLDSQSAKVDGWLTDCVHNERGVYLGIKDGASVAIFAAPGDAGLSLATKVAAKLDNCNLSQR